MTASVLSLLISVPDGRPQAGASSKARDTEVSVNRGGRGFSYVGSVHEGFPYAAAICSKGYNAFVLRYRAGHGGTAATQDLAAALSYIFRNAETLRVSTDGYSLWGSSAGARMAAAIGSHGVAHFGGGDVPKPSAIVMAYTAHSDYSSAEPPTFVVVGEHDGIAPPAIMLRTLAVYTGREAGSPSKARDDESARLLAPSQSALPYAFFFQYSSVVPV